MNFQFAQTLIDALSLGSIYAVTALGIGIIFSVMRLINFAHAQYIVICSFAILVPYYTGLTSTTLATLPVYLLVPGIVLLGAGLAVLSELVLFRHLRNADAATMLIASFALGLALYNLMLMGFGSRPHGVDLWPGLTATVVVAGLRFPLLQPVIILVVVSILIAAVLFLKHSKFGLALRASAENFTMARMVGVPANRVILFAFAASGGLAGVTSLLLLPQTGLVSVRMGDQIVLLAFVACVIGGLGSLVGAVTAGFLIGIFSVVLQTALPVEYRPFRDAFVYMAVILVLLFLPNGMFSGGGRGRRV